MSVDSSAPRGTPGPKKDARQSVEFKVEPDAYAMLLALQPETSLAPDLAAAMLFHKMMRNPEGCAALLGVLLPVRPSASAANIDRPTDLAVARQARDSR
jgi:hypothetical protein